MLSRDHHCKNDDLRSAIGHAGLRPLMLHLTSQPTDDNNDNDDDENDDNDNDFVGGRWDTWTKAGLNEQQLVQFVHR